MTIISGVGSSGSVGPTSGGKVYGFNNLDAVTPVLIAPANTSRKKIGFHNPGSVDVLVYPALLQTTGSSVAAAVTVAAKGGGYLIYANGGERWVDGECSGAWYALAISAANNPLTVTDSNV